MVFSSYAFIFAFLPLVMAVCFAARKSRVFLYVIVLSSFVFYGYWNVSSIYFLASSIFLNYTSARIIEYCRLRSYVIKNTLFIFIVLFDMSSIFIFKYYYFVSTEIFNITGSGFPSIGQVILPLGISFFTFQQVAYVVDVYKGEQSVRSLTEYTVFVSFFPQLIAGPIMYHKHIIPQIDHLHKTGFTFDNFRIGAVFFIIGIFKKLFIADNLSYFYVDDVFFSAAMGHSIPFFEAWGAAIAYCLQLYFDFSGYSDMAIGLGKFFGIDVPANFNSPYKARGIVDFWRRWHITLSQFLRNYLYIPLGGSRCGPVRAYVNVMIVMLLGGAWHGAGLTFILWGFLHGVFIGLERLLRVLPLATSRFARFFPVTTLTFVIVTVLWVPFRATNFDGALAMLKGMFFGNGIEIPVRFTRLLPGFMTTETQMYVTFRDLGESCMACGAPQMVVLLGLYLIVRLMPNSLDIMDYKPENIAAGRSYDAPYHGSSLLRSWLRWKPNAVWGLIVGLMGGLALISMRESPVFIYFQF